METIFLGILEQMGISGIVGGLIYLLVTREAYHRKEKRDRQIDELKEDNKEIKESMKEHKRHHNNFEKEIYEKLNTALLILEHLKGYMDGKNDKGK